MAEVVSVLQKEQKHRFSIFVWFEWHCSMSSKTEQNNTWMCFYWTLHEPKPFKHRAKWEGFIVARLKYTLELLSEGPSCVGHTIQISPHLHDILQYTSVNYTQESLANRKNERLLEMNSSSVAHTHSPTMPHLIWTKMPKNHWPSASDKDSSALEESLCGRACCWGWMGSASQCSIREDGGRRWPYKVPALGGSKGGKKYLNNGK